MAKWHFPPFSFGTESGVSDSGSVHFADSPIKSFIRESIQNSIDARHEDSDVVEVKIQLHQIACNKIPDWNNLTKSMAAMIADAEKQVGNASINSTVVELKKCLEKIKTSSNVCMLEFSDFNTTGLVGAGSDRGMDNRFYRLLFQPGMNNSTGDKGGTWGLGKFAPFSASELRTVFYSTFLENSKEALLIGKSILANHDLDGERYSGTGFFGENVKGRNIQPVAAPSFFSISNRSRLGTSLFILEPKLADSEKPMELLLRPVIESYYAAILHGRLTITFVDERDSVALNAENLVTMADEFFPKEMGKPRISDFIKALLNEPKIEETDFGTFKLYLQVLADGKMAHTDYMRRPRQKVNQWRMRIQMPVAAVFLIDDDKGNNTFAGMENVKHDCWYVEHAPGRDRDGVKAVKSALSWVKKKLQEETMSLCDTHKSVPIGPRGSNIDIVQTGLKSPRIAGSSEHNVKAGLGQNSTSPSNNPAHPFGVKEPGTGGSRASQSTVKNGGARKGAPPAEVKVHSRPAKPRKGAESGRPDGRSMESNISPKDPGSGSAKLKIKRIFQGGVDADGNIIYTITGEIDNDANVYMKLLPMLGDEPDGDDEDSFSLKIIQVKCPSSKENLRFEEREDGYVSIPLKQGPVSVSVTSNDVESYRLKLDVK